VKAVCQQADASAYVYLSIENKKNINEDCEAFTRATRSREPSAEESFLDLFKKDIFR